MRMRALALAFAALLLPANFGHAQNTLETQPQVPIGGSDTRSLPSASQLPPMFGANLFTSPFNVQMLGVTPAAPGGTAGVTTPGAMATGAMPTPATAGLAAALGAGAAAVQQPGQQAATAPVTPQTPIVAPTSVQPPGGVAAFDPNHVIAPGDVIQVHIYGATSLDQQATVDGNGEIFLPSVGPVHVAGTTAGNLQSVVSAAVASVYQKNSQVYVTLAAAVPINVFVTGAVLSPSQYTLPSTASIITFLQAAGGINPTRGSYRDIQILRDGRSIATVDLYDFLLRGRLPPVRLRDRDTILVRQQGPTIAALGDVRGIYRYEIEKPYTGEQLIALARPLPDATHVSLLGIRGGKPNSLYFSLSEFRGIALQDGDIVTFSPDVPTGVMTVKVDGRVDGPTTLVVTRTATLLDVLAYLPVDSYFADTSAIYVRRLSVAQAQKKAIDDALRRLESTVVTSPTVTAEQATMRQQEAQIIFQFGQQLANVQPEGRLVVSYDGHVSNVRLEDGDVIVVPSRTDLVLISGEVRVPQSLVWIRGAPIDQYIETAGGFTERADTSKLLVIRPSGQTIVGSHPPVMAGDRIIVLPSPSNWALPFIKDITQIIYQIAVGVGVLVRL